MNNITRQEYNQTKNELMKEIKKIKEDIGDIKVDIARLPEKLREYFDNHYVSKDSFKPIQKVVYGLVGAILLTIIGAIMTMVLK